VTLDAPGPPPGQRSGPATEMTGQAREDHVTAGDPTGSGRQTERTNNRVRLRQLLAQIDLDQQAKLRDIQQDILQACSWWWRWRAEQFRAARPRPDEYHGRLPHDQQIAAWWRCEATARACEHKAAFLDMLAAEHSDLAEVTLPLDVIAEEVA
jgi:hypothetical protein